MKITSSILIAAALLATGIISYQWGKNSNLPRNPHQIEEEVKNELVALTAKDFEEYQNLKGLEDRYKKADEILGKIVTIFLADLGLKLSFQPVNPAMIEGACTIPMAASTPLPSSPAPLASSPPPSLASSPPPAAKAPGNAWVQGEKELLRIQNEEHALEELKKLAIPDICTTLTNARPWNPPTS